MKTKSSAWRRFFSAISRKTPRTDRVVSSRKKVSKSFKTEEILNRILASRLRMQGL